MSDTGVKGKDILITGAAKRLGREMALALAKAGASILVHYNTSSAQAEELLRDLRKLGAKAAKVSADLSDLSNLDKIVSAAEQEFGKLDVLINNASTFPQSNLLRASASIDSETLDSFRRTLAVNLEAPFFLTQKLQPLLEKSGDGLVLNILDAHAFDGFYSRPAYAASKAGLAAITKSTAGILAPTIRVCGLELGKILPGEGMSEEEAAKVDWVGAESVVEAVLQLLTQPLDTGYIKQLK